MPFLSAILLIFRLNLAFVMNIPLFAYRGPSLRTDIFQTQYTFSYWSESIQGSTFLSDQTFSNAFRRLLQLFSVCPLRPWPRPHDRSNHCRVTRENRTKPSSCGKFFVLRNSASLVKSASFDASLAFWGSGTPMATPKCQNRKKSRPCLKLSVVVESYSGYIGCLR